MRRYLATLHKRSDSHKKNFALLASGGVTLSIFAIWLFVNYGQAPVVAEADAAPSLAAVHEVGPLQSLGESLSSSWDALTESFKGLTGALKTGADLEKGYEEMKAKSLNQY
ncbi:hypothetical protein KW784_02275 [Candidatus Parcubacteria bacterium]|nr:hypothetical protein [Candidatus Parcubacteria bacterium]